MLSKPADLRGADRCHHVARLMLTAEHAQAAAVEGLRADAEAVHACCPHRGEPGFVDAVRIGFQRDFGLEIERERFAAGGEDAVDLLWFEERGGPSPEVDGLGGCIRDLIRYVAHEGVDIAGNQRIQSAIGVEIAVGADVPAKGNVDVNADRRVIGEGGH